MKVNRRELLKNAAFVSGAALVGASWPSSKKLFAQDVLLDLPNLPSPANSGIEHIVVVTMENRSFRPFSRMAAERGWQASWLDVYGQRRREPRDSFALR